MKPYTSKDENSKHCVYLRTGKRKYQIHSNPTLCIYFHQNEQPQTGFQKTDLFPNPQVLRLRVWGWGWRQQRQQNSEFGFRGTRTKKALKKNIIRLAFRIRPLLVNLSKLSAMLIQNNIQPVLSLIYWFTNEHNNIYILQNLDFHSHLLTMQQSGIKYIKKL